MDSHLENWHLYNRKSPRRKEAAMNMRTMQMGVVVVLAMVGVGVASAAESPGLPPTATENAELDKLVGQPVDIRRGRTRGVLIWRFRRKRKHISSPGVSNAWTRFTGRLSPHCLSNS